MFSSADSWRTVRKFLIAVPMNSEHRPGLCGMTWYPDRRMLVFVCCENEMAINPSRFAEYEGDLSHWTGFTTLHVDICRAFAIPVPEDCLSSCQIAAIEKTVPGRTRHTRFRKTSEYSPMISGAAMLLLIFLSWIYLFISWFCLILYALLIFANAVVRWRSCFSEMSSLRRPWRDSGSYT